MNSKFILLILGIIGLTLIGGGCFGYIRQKGFSMNYDEINTAQEVIDLFPKNSAHVDALVDHAKKEATKSIKAIIAVPDNQRTFANTIDALDMAGGYYFSISDAIVSVLHNVSPDDALRNASNQAVVELSKFAIENFGQNIALYNAVKAYANGNALKEKLTSEQQYFLKETMEDYKRAGLELPEEQRNKVKELQNKLSELSVKFSNNINEDKSSVTVTLEELDGLEEDFIKGLKKTDDGNYILTTDYPTYVPVIEYGKVPATRKRMYHAFQNRAYPANKEVFADIIANRDELAKTLGFESFAALNIDSEMAKKPEIAQAFIENLIAKAQEKAQKEFQELLTDLPESVKLENNKLNPWDGAFAKEAFKKKHYDIDDREIKQYFPTEKTVQGLLKIYEKFFNITLKKVQVSGLWDNEAEMIEAYKGDTLLGYLIIDLYPRPNKYSHACMMQVAPALKTKEGIKPAVIVVLANFPKSTPEKPSLLELSNVRTFFHEFGHAIHGILGATSLASTSGTRVKTDFVEMPSQMLEEWLWDAGILKMLSSHYKTGEQLPDELIKKIIAAKNFSTGAWVLNQSLYSLMSLNYYTSGKNKDVLGIMFKLQEQILPNINIYKESRMPYSFGHLTDYGAKYYGYLWSKVFALDLFDHIKKFGLLNPEIGEVYGQKVIGKGGSQDPNELLEDFLGRKPNDEAFFKDMGL
jgi:thimet oligopeptidase